MFLSASPVLLPGSWKVCVDEERCIGFWSLAETLRIVSVQGVVNAAKSSIASARSTIDSTTGDAKNWSMVKRYQAKKAACKRLGCCPDQQM